MDNRIFFRDLSSEQARQFVDVRQIFGALRDAEIEARHRFAGTMAWKTVSGGEYLYRRRGPTERSLGRRSAETEKAETAFRNGKARNATLIKGLRRRIEGMAPVNVALGLGRVPNVVARIMRRLDTLGLLGPHVAVVGTNALFAYETSAGAQFRSDLLATTDVDFALDVRRHLGLASALPAPGLVGVLQKIDPSFQMSRPGGFRAVNKDGFMVDLITTAPKDVLRRTSARRLSNYAEDISAVEVVKLHWLIHAPRFEAVAIAQDGLPLRLSVADPRFFAAHKLWLSERDDRAPEQRGRDRQQALAVATLLAGPLSNLALGDAVLAQLPVPLREELHRAVAAAPVQRPIW